ncbi:MAG: hypothetical protein LBB82_02475 [Treponema sp.]|jgi:hypothetical protein|nr:hypothetical protein [Treponema sp.]
MKKPKCGVFILLGLLIPFILISCKTTAAGPDSLVDSSALTGDPSGPPSDDALAALAKARANAEESRDKAEYVKGEEYFPAEWTAAGELYSQAAGREEPETGAETVARIGEWNGINTAYDKIYKDSLERFCGEQAQVLVRARDEAVEAGAQELVPDRFKLADDLAASAQEKADKKDYAGSASDGKAARDRYSVLKTLAEASAKQDEADALNLYAYDPENYDLAAAAGNDAVEFYDAGDLAAAQDSANESLLRFNLVIQNGHLALAESASASARESREAAQEVKADVASRADFDAADEVYNEAHAALRENNYVEAERLFDESAGLFETARDNAAAKRRQAEEALRQAEERLLESDQKAKAADEVIGGGN